MIYKIRQTQTADAKADYRKIAETTARVGGETEKSGRSRLKAPDHHIGGGGQNKKIDEAHGTPTGGRHTIANRRSEGRA